MLNSARFLQSHELSNGKLGATGFCWGGGTTNFLAVTMGGDLHAGVPFYGRAPASGDVGKIRAPLLIQSAEPAISICEVVHGLMQIRFLKFRPKLIRNPKFGVPDLPQQKITYSHFSCSPD